MRSNWDKCLQLANVLAVFYPFRKCFYPFRIPLHIISSGFEPKSKQAKNSHYFSHKWKMNYFYQYNHFVSSARNITLRIIEREVKCNYKHILMRQFRSIDVLTQTQRQNTENSSKVCVPIDVANWMEHRSIELYAQIFNIQIHWYFLNI